MCFLCVVCTSASHNNKAHYISFGEKLKIFQNSDKQFKGGFRKGGLEGGMPHPFDRRTGGAFAHTSWHLKCVRFFIYLTCIFIFSGKRERNIAYKLAEIVEKINQLHCKFNNAVNYWRYLHCLPQ